GGAADSTTLSTRELWRLDARGWTIEEPVGANARSHHGLVYDSGRRRLVAYGGLASGVPIRATLERLAPTPLERIVPIVLDVYSGTAHFTTELAITNRGASAVDLTLRYTAAIGDPAPGSGSVPARVEAGAQLVLPDVLAYLRQKGLAIPEGT